jgi:hypothetical protein
MKCALNAMPACLPRSNDFRVILRVSIGSAPQILAVELNQVEGAEDCGLARPVPADKIEHRKAFLIGDDRLAVDEARACRKRRDRRGGQRETHGEIVAMTSEEPHAWCW